jgi:hypothetical protein
MTDNYQSSGEHVRNLADLRAKFEVLESHGKFRIVRVDFPYFEGYEFWVVNERGFLWEPAKDLGAAQKYLESEEAQDYNTGSEA